MMKFYLVMIYGLIIGSFAYIQGCSHIHEKDSTKDSETTLSKTDQIAPIWMEGSQLTIQIPNTSDGSTIVMIWTAAEDDSAIKRYLVYQDDTIIATLGPNVTALQVDRLQVDQSYEFQVQAEDIFDHLSTDGPSATFIAEDIQAPHFGQNATLAIEEIEREQVVLTWSAAEDNVSVNRYEIYQNTMLIDTVDGHTQEFLITELSANLEYTFTIQALDASDHRSTDGPRARFTLSPRPQAPTWPENAMMWATEITETSMWLRWNEAQDDQAVYLYRVLQDGREIALQPANTPYLFLEGLNPYTSFSFEVYAQDHNGLESDTLTVNVQTIDQTAPQWPTDSILTAEIGTENHMILRWTPAIDETGIETYTIYQDQIPLESIPATSNEYTISDRSTQVEYLFRVEATDHAGNHSNTGPVRLLKLLDENPPRWSEDTRFTFDQLQPTSVQLIWSAAQDDTAVVAYHIEYDEMLVATTNADTFSAFITDLPANTNITLILFAIDQAGNRSEGLSIQLPMPDFAIPSWPAEAQLLASNLTSTSVQLTWTALVVEPMITQYEIYQDDVLIETVSSENHTLTIDHLEPNITMLLRIEAVGPSGLISNNGPTLEITTPDLNAPSWPIGASVVPESIGETEITLAWSPFTPIDQIIQYEVFQDAVSIATIATTAQSLSVNHLNALTTYQFTIQAIGTTGLRSGNGPTLVVTTIDESAPMWPLNSTLIATQVTHNSFTLTWNQATDNVAINDYRLVIEGLGEWSMSNRSQAINDLMPDTDYHCSVFAIDTTGNETAIALHTTVRTLDHISLTNQDVFDALTSSCHACHGAGSSPYFESLASFESLIINDIEMIHPGDPDASLLIRILEGNGNAPWSAMPLGSMNFRQLSDRGQTQITIEELRTWVRNLGE